MRLIDADALEKDLFPDGTSGGYWGFGQLCEMLDRQPTLEAIPKGAYEQVKWERDMAISQLNDYGVQFGEKADVQAVRHGKWENYPSHTHRRCSLCKMEWEKPRFNVRANYCPNCGAKMEGVQ